MPRSFSSSMESFCTDAVFSAHIMDGMDSTCVEEDSLCESSLTGIDVCTNSDVA